MLCALDGTRFSSFFYLLRFFGFVAIRATGQQAVPSPSASGVATVISGPQIEYDKRPLPSDPAAALDLVRKANGLSSDSLKPWYLKAHYQTFDPRGKPGTQGVFKIYWENKDHYRVEYASDHFNQSVYHTAEGGFRTGSSERMPYGESMIWDELMYPLETVAQAPAPTVHDTKLGNTAMTCIEVAALNQLSDAYCVDQHELVLRAVAKAGYIAIFNKNMIFQHRIISGEISVRDDGQQVLTLGIEELRSLRSTDAPQLVPPAEATKIPILKDSPQAGPSRLIPAGVMAGHLISKTAPVYAAEAKQRRAQGRVRIAATIGTDGALQNLIIVKDPDSALSSSALQTVSKWRYMPYLLNGTPVEVDTVIQVNFRMGD